MIGDTFCNRMYRYLGAPGPSVTVMKNGLKLIFSVYTFCPSLILLVMIALSDMKCVHGKGSIVTVSLHAAQDLGRGW